MYAVIETGGKQYRVELGNEIEVERLDVEPGQTITFERVLLVVDGDEAAVGRPVVDGAVVTADVLRQDRGEKIVVFKYKPKARTRVKQGHRQELTVLRIGEIAYGGKSAAEESAGREAEERKAAKAAADAAASKAAADQALAEKLAAEAAAAKAEAEAKAVKTAKPATKAAKSTTTAKSSSTGTKATSSTSTRASSSAKASTDQPKASGKGTAARTQAGEGAAKPAPKPRTTKKDE